MNDEEIVRRLKEGQDLHQLAALRIEELNKALRFYSRWGIVSPWNDSQIIKDSGHTARVAIHKHEVALT